MTRTLPSNTLAEGKVQHCLKSNFLRILFLLLLPLFLTACGGGGGGGSTTSGPITLSGTAYDAAIVGGTVTVKDLSGAELGSTTSDENGKFTLDINEDRLANGYTVSITGGTMDGVTFTEILTATYSSADAKDAINLTALTTLVDTLAAELTGNSLDKRAMAIQQLATLGLLQTTDWNHLTSDHYDLQSLALRIQDAGGMQAWLDLIKIDLVDGELSLAESRSIFPKAHGGVESVSAYSGISVFPGERSETGFLVNSKDLEGELVVKLLNAPSWVTVEGRNVVAEPPVGEAPAVHTLDVEVSPNGTITGRKTQVNISVLKQVTLLQGTLGINGGTIENAWRDITISVPAGALTQNYEITYYAGINAKNEAIFSFKYNPELSATEHEELIIHQPSSGVLRADYLSDSRIVKNNSIQGKTLPYLATATATQNSSFLKPDFVTSECWTEWDKHGWEDGQNGLIFEFSSILRNWNGDFYRSAPGMSAKTVFAVPRILPKYMNIKKHPINWTPKCASMLVKYNSLSAPSKKEPILLIHGYSDGLMAEINSYFYKFPKLLMDAGYPVYGFFWNTNQRFEDAANNLGAAIKEINNKQDTQLHIVAHSFGGLLARTLLQGLAKKLDDRVNSEYDANFMEKRIASVTTVGTPHSGVFGIDLDRDSVSFDNNDPIAFNYGRHGAGHGIEGCAALTCQEAGEEWFELTNKMKVFGVEDNPGQIVYRLANSSYPNVPTQVLIGIIPEYQACNDFDGTSVKACKMDYTARADNVGDGLISLAGQRFYPWDHKKYLKTGIIEEHLLGFNASSTLFFRGWQNAYMDKINGSIQRWPTEQLFTYYHDIFSFYKSDVNQYSTVQYNHRGDQYNLSNYNKQGRVSTSNPLFDSVLKRKVPVLTEVGLQNCTSHTDCDHATWDYVNSMIALHPAKPFTGGSVSLIKASGNIAYTTSTVAALTKGITASVVAQATSVNLEGFVIKIYLDGELLGTAKTDANGAFEKDVEFKANRTYVVEIHAPISLDAALKPKVAVVTKTSAATVEETNFDFSLIELVKNERAPLLGNLGITLKNGDTGEVLLGYNLAVSNVFGSLLVDKFVDVVEDAHVTLPHGQYAVRITTPGYSFTGEGSLTCTVSEFQSSPCVITITDVVVGNQSPTANAQTIVVDQNSLGSTITLTGNDPEDDDLAYTIATYPQNGTLSGTAPNLTYTPIADYTGADGFSFTVNDGVQNSIQTATITLNVTSVTVPPVTPTGKLNDTGITWGGNYPSGNNTTCIGETVAQQDCSHGRDATHNDDSDGHAGFSYTKLDPSGNNLPASATSWSCVKDNVTGLIWEVKKGGVGDVGLHDADDSYNWYNTDPTTNGGTDGYADDDGAICHGYDVNNLASYCNTQAYAARINAASLCGATDWRLPTKMELVGLTNKNRTFPAIDAAYFPNTKSMNYWSSSAVPYNPNNARYVYFDTGRTSDGNRDGNLPVRLVRSSP